MGRPKQKNAVKLTLTVDKDIRDAARRIAQDEQSSISALLEHLVKQEYERAYRRKLQVHPPKPKKL